MGLYGVGELEPKSRLFDLDCVGNVINLEKRALKQGRANKLIGAFTEKDVGHMASAQPIDLDERCKVSYDASADYNAVSGSDKS